MTSLSSNAEGTHAAPTERMLSPFIEWDDFRIHNPHTNMSVTRESPEWPLLTALRNGQASPPLTTDDLALLAKQGWLVKRDADLSSAYLLRIVSLEVATLCNQKCYFCPVSVDPREDEEMPDSLFASIVEQLTAYRSTLEGVFLQSYNEPTVHRRFVRHCHELMAAKLPVAVLTNGSGLSPKRVDEILESGRLRYLGVNLSTLDRERYKAERGADHLPVVLKNLDYIATTPVSDEMRILVLGKDDSTHADDLAAIKERFRNTPFKVEGFSIMDRAGYLGFGLSTGPDHRTLAGCDNIGSRPIQHLHITPSGNCILCCQDYDEDYVVGNLKSQSVHEVMSGPQLSKMRRWAYGIDEAPDDFICRKCIYAKTRDGGGTHPA